MLQYNMALPPWCHRRDLLNEQMSRTLDQIYLYEKFTKELSEPIKGSQKFNFEIWCPTWTHGQTAAGELTIFEAGVRVSHLGSCVTSPNIESETIAVDRIRYVVLSPLCMLPVPSNNIVLLSWKTDNFKSVRFLFMRLSDTQEALLLVNMIRNLQYNLHYPFMESFKYFQPLCVSHVPMMMSEDKDKTVKPNLKPTFCLVDPEVLVALRDDMSPKPIFEAFWYTSDQFSGSAENVKLDHSVNMISVNTNEGSIIIKLQDTSKADKVLAASILHCFKRIEPVEQSIFTEPGRQEEHFALKGQQYFPVEILNSEQRELEKAFKENYGKTQSDPLAEQQELEALREAELASTFGSMDLNKISEDMNILWVAAEAEINEIIASGFVPGSSISSGGLDPNSVDHLQKCIDEITEALFTQSYDVALSHVRGCRDVFKTSRLHQAKRLFQQTRPDVEVLKDIFLRSLLNQ